MFEEENINTNGGSFIGRDDNSLNITINSSSKRVIVLPSAAPYRTESLIGRIAYLEKIIYSLEHQRQHVITLTGIGGVGKSSLAYYVCKKLQINSSFEYIIWISAKDSRLTTNGVEKIIPELKNLDDLFERILVRTNLMPKGEFADLSSKEKQESVNDYLSMAKFLIVIDNLETVEFTEQIERFIENIPSPSKVLITTRKADIVGEMRININKMDKDEAIKLLREEAKIFEAKELQNATDTQLFSLIDKFGYIPLALSFLVSLSVEGFSLGAIVKKISNIEEAGIIDFCFKEVYEKLSELSKKIFLSLIVLSHEDRSEQIIRELCENDTKENISCALSRLKDVSWIFENITDGITIYDMLPLTEVFGKLMLDKENGSERIIRDRYARVLREGKAYRDAETQDKIVFYSKIGAKSETEKRAAYIAKIAQELHDRGLKVDAWNRINDSIDLAPKLSYVYQIQATLLRNEMRYSEARVAYEKAFNLSNPPYWGIKRRWLLMEREAHNFSLMAKLAQEYFKIYPMDKKILQIFGIYKSKDLKEYQTADEIFRSALYKTPTDIRERYHNVIVYHSMGINMKEWAKSVVNIPERKLLLKKAIEIIDLGLKIDSENEKCKDVKKECQGQLAILGN